MPIRSRRHCLREDVQRERAIGELMLESPATMDSESQPPRNALSIFLVHFHVRRGNELIWQKGEADCQGVEWKALPSGSHAMERDIIYFESPSSSAHSRHKKIGIAAFRNRKLKVGERVGASGEGQGEDDDQRGARLMAVGAILNCGETASPWSILCATLPHIAQLEKLVDALSADPSCRGLLEEWLDAHEFREDDADFPVQRDHEVLDLVHIHDPLLQLPAITTALGPLLPSLLKRLLLPSFRLLLFIPPGAQTYRAGAIAFALGELACSSHRTEGGSTSKSSSSVDQQTIRIRGLVGLHDLGMLHDEAKSGSNEHSWIAWTTDKILLDKFYIYDALLDLSSMKVLSANDGDLLDMPAALPKLTSIRKTISVDQKGSFDVRRQTWTTREFAIFRGLDEQASSRMTFRRKKLAKADHEDVHATQEFGLEASPSKILSRQGSASTFLAFLRFWLSNLWILPLRWRVNIRESYGYVPLSIRSDGGVRASIMLLPDEDDEEEDSEDDEENASDVASQHLSLPLASPSHDRRLHGVQDHSVLDEEDDPILAACGATRASLRHRRSRSHSSASHSGLQSVAKVIAASQLGPDEQHTSYAISTSDSYSRGASEEEEIQIEAKESIRLAASIYQVWSLWVEELVEGIQIMTQHKLSAEQQGDARPPTDGEGREGLLSEGDDDRPMTFHAGELSELRLSVTNPVDVELLRHVAGCLTDRQVLIQKSWWSAASSFWS